MSQKVNERETNFLFFIFLVVLPLGLTISINNVVEKKTTNQTEELN